jgi:hypothetical protein
MAPVDYSQLPAFPPPPGITANFDNPPSIAWQITAFSLPFSGTATIFVALRLYARAHILRFLGLDDREFNVSSLKVITDILASVPRPRGGTIDFVSVRTITNFILRSCLGHSVHWELLVSKYQSTRISLTHGQ